MSQLWTLLQLIWHANIFNCLIQSARSPSSCVQTLTHTVTHTQSPTQLQLRLDLVFTISLTVGMNMHQGPFRLHKACVFLYWTPVETIFYKLRLSTCRLRSFFVFLSSSLFTPCLDPVCSSSPSELWIQIESSSCFTFLCPGCPCMSVGMFVCVWASVCICLCGLLMWMDCQRRQCAWQQHVARPIDPFRGMCSASIQSCMFEGNWRLEEVKLFMWASEKVALNALALEHLQPNFPWV